MGFLGQLFGGTSLDYKPQGLTPAQMEQSYQQTQGSIAQQQAFLNAIQAAGGAIPGLQANLAQQLAAQAQGEGPNIAAAQLAETTAANAARQAALMASQRGASTSAGSIARMAAQQGSQVQQAAAGQAATLRAQQQLAAQQALGTLTGQMMGQRQTALSQLGGMSATQQGQLLQSQAERNRIEAEMAMQRAKAQQAAVGGLFNVAGQAALMSMGMPSAPSIQPTEQASQQPSWSSGDLTHSFGFEAGRPTVTTTTNLANGGMVEEPYLPSMRNGPQNTGSILGDYAFTKSFSDGGLVPGKADFGGDNIKNDTVSAMLSPGEIVIPRSVLKQKNPAEASKKFVQAVLAKKRQS